MNLSISLIYLYAYKHLLTLYIDSLGIEIPQQQEGYSCFGDNMLLAFKINHKKPQRRDREHTVLKQLRVSEGKDVSNKQGTWQRTCQKDTEISLRGSHRLTLGQYSKTNSYYNKATEKGRGQEPKRVSLSCREKQGHG